MFLLDIASNDEMFSLVSDITNTIVIITSVEPTSRISNSKLIYCLYFINEISVILVPRYFYMISGVGMVLIMIFIIILFVVCFIVRKRNKQSLTQNQGMYS